MNRLYRKTGKPLYALSLGLLTLFFLIRATCTAAEPDSSFGFDLESFAKKPLQWGGYLEGKFEHFSLNKGGSLYFLGDPDRDRSTLDRGTGTLQVDGSYSLNRNSFNWLIKASASQDQERYDDWADIYEAYLRLRPADMVTVEAGKQSYKWGTGYAWNPVGFLNRRKDPNDPGEDLEGFISLEGSWIRSFGSTVESMAATVSILPVWDGVNEEFGRRDHINLAARLYLLVKKTDIDLVCFAGDSRSSRYGVDFATNISTNFAIHGEFAWIPNANRVVLEQDDTLQLEEYSSTSYLLGMRYLSDRNVTTILEYYHNGNGYTQDEMSRFYRLAYAAREEQKPAAAARLLEKAMTVSRSGYGALQTGRNYGYARVTWKEPFDILYFTPGITGIFNIDDRSWMLTPELLYTGVTNWELRLRVSFLSGRYLAEYGEKATENKIELRARYFF
ncbi:hypothetical protein [Desulfomarina sp.]